MKQRTSLYIAVILTSLMSCAFHKPIMNVSITPDLALPDRPRIAVLPMELAGYGDEDITVARQNWRNMVESGFLENSFRVVDREIVDNILNEQHFQKSGAVSNSTSVEIGKILGINLVLVGTVRVLAADGSKFHVQLRIVDVQSAELVATSFATGDAGVGYRAAYDMAKKIRLRFNTLKVKS